MKYKKGERCKKKDIIMNLFLCLPLFLLNIPFYFILHLLLLTIHWSPKEPFIASAMLKSQVSQQHSLRTILKNKK